MNATRRQGVAVLGLAALAGAAACATHGARGGGSAEPRPGQSSFWNEGSQLALGVDVRTTRLAGPVEFLPLAFVLLDKDQREITVSRESFILVRPDGVQLPAASVEEFWSDYPRPRADLRSARTFFETVFGRFPAPPYHWIEAEFFPERHSGVVPRQGFTLRLADGIFGFLYFRHPADRGPAPVGTYQLLLRPAGAERTFVLDFVPYAVPAQDG
jgi:hypothetical protein